MPSHVTDGVAKQSKLFRRGFSSAGDEGESGYALCFIVLCLSEAFIFTDEVVYLRLGLVVGRLRTPFTVFRAASGLGIDDGTHVEFVLCTGHGNLMGSCIECLFIGCISQPGCLLGRYIDTAQHLVFHFFNSHK